MPLQLPSRSAAQVDDIKQGISVNALYPYTFRINRTFTAGNFPTVDSGGSGDYVTITWTPALSLAIVMVEASSLQPSGAGYVAAVQVSLANVMTLGDAPSLLLPTDEANIIASYIFSPTYFSAGETRYMPSDYYIVQGTPVYISFWIASGAIGNAGSIMSNVLIHTVPLGVGA